MSTRAMLSAEMEVQALKAELRTARELIAELVGAKRANFYQEAFDVSPQAADLLALMVAQAPRLVSFQAIWSGLWGADPQGGPLTWKKVIAVKTYELRTHLYGMGAPRGILTVKYVGMSCSGELAEWIDGRAGSRNGLGEAAA